NNIIVCGCISENIRKAAEKASATEIISTTELHKMFTQGDQMFPEIQKAKPHFVISDNSLCNRQYENIEKHNQNIVKKLLKRKTTVPFLVIARGCNNRCSYCHSRFYMGPLKSKEKKQIISEYKTLLNQAYRFINIIAGDVGAYGSDISENLPDLLSELDKNTPDRKVSWMLDGLQPKWYVKYKNALSYHIAKKRITAMSIPMQSGSNRILKLMNRPQNRQEALNILLQFKRLNPKIYLQGIFIVGFPDEKDEDFEQSIDFIKQIKFNDVTLIPYSEFNICNSAEITPKIPASTINLRIQNATNMLNDLGIYTHG
ncbi:MAG: radical SAM protein, partial [Bacteroidales bacterium]